MKNNFYHTKKALFFFVISMCIFSACKSSKETTTDKVALERISKEERVNKIIKSEISYNTISADLKFAVKGMSVNTQMRMIKDKVIQFSFRYPFPLTGEAFKVIVTPDEVIIIDRLNKQYMKEPMKNIKNKFPFQFDYYSLEAMLSNKLFIAGKKEISQKDIHSFNIEENDYEVKINYTDKQNTRYDFISNYTNRIQETQINQHNLQAKIICNYTNWGKTSDKKDFPMTISYTLLIPNKSHNISMAFRSVDINSNFNIDYDIPTKYKQVTFEQVINLLKKLL